MVVRTGSVVWGDWASLFSNAAFLVPLVLSIKAARPVRTLLFVCVPVFSTFYHLCDSNINSCLMPYQTLYGLDNFFAMMAAVSVALSMTTLPGVAWDIVLQLVAGIPIFFMIEYDYRPMWLYVVLIASFFSAVLVSWWALYRFDDETRFKQFHWPALLAGAAVMGAGVAIFAVLDAYPNKYTHNNKMLLHSGWHLGVGLGSGLFLWATLLYPRSVWKSTGFAWTYENVQ